MNGHWRVYLVLAAGVFVISWSAIFVRLADAPALSIAALRLTIAAAPVGALTALRHRPALVRLGSGARWALVGSGVALALHFATWIGSLGLTSVASSVALVTTQPLWAAAISALVLRERVSRGTALAIAVASAGGVLIGLRDLAAGGAALAGDGLALLGALFAAIYLAFGRQARGGLALGPYIGVVYSVAALALLLAALLGRQPLHGFSGQTWLMLLLLALGPQLIGHTSLNWALRYLPAHLVALAILGEPVLSTLLAIPLLGEWPGALRVCGGAVTLVGVYLAVRLELRQRPNTVSAPARRLTDALAGEELRN